MGKSITVLGSTGSIGVQTLDVVRSIGDIKVKALAVDTNIEILERQIDEFKPVVVSVMDGERADTLRKKLKYKNCAVLSGIEGLIEAACVDGTDTVVNAVVGSVGLRPTLAAIDAKKNIALANKETLVTAGALVMKKAWENGVRLYPIDSEHSAIFQCLKGNESERIRNIYLTASGGPFRTFAPEDLKNVSLKQALKHPNWVMGKKITIDSATMMNKGLEVIEAKWLFDVDAANIKVLVHPQSIIHSMVEFEDGSVLAQLGEADMRVPIAYALTYPGRVKNNFPKIDFLLKNNLTFEAPRPDVFGCLNLAYEAINIGGTMPAVLNAANELAVKLFLEEKIGFLDIQAIIKKTMDAYTVTDEYLLEDVLKAEAFAQDFVFSDTPLERG